MAMTIASTGGGRSSTIRRHSPQVILLIAPVLRRRSSRRLCSSPIRACIELDPSGAFGAFTFGHFAAIFSSRTFGSVLVNSAVYSLGSALLALVIGAAQAWLAERTDASSAAGSLCRLDRIARHSLCSLYRRLDSVPGQSRSGQRASAADVRRRWALHQRLFARRDDLRRRPAVVAARLPAAVAGVPQFRCVVRRGREHLRRRFVFDAPARHARHGAAGAAGAGPAGLHQGVRVLRGAGAGRPAGLDACADQHDLSAADVGHAAGHRQRIGLRRAAARRHGDPAANLQPRGGADPSLSNGHRKGLSPARHSSRPLALRRGRADRRYSLRRRCHPAGDDPVGGAAAVLSAVQHQGVAAARLRQFRAGA